MSLNVSRGAALETKMTDNVAPVSVLPPNPLQCGGGHAPRTGTAQANEGVVNSSRPLQGKRIVSEKRPECSPGPGRVPELSEEETDHLVAFRRGRRMQIAITMDNKEKVSALWMTELRHVSGIRSFYWCEKGCGDRSGASPAAGRWERLYVTAVELSTINSLASVAVAEERLHSFPPL